MQGKKSKAKRYGVKPRGKKFVANPYIRSLGKTHWVGTFDTEDEAIRAAITTIDELARMEPSKETIGSFTKRWLDDYPRAKESTADHYRSCAKQLCEFQFGPKKGRDIKIRSFTRLQARRFAKEKPGAARAMRTMWTDAKDEGTVIENVWLGLALGGEGRKQRRKSYEVLSLADVARLAEIAGDAFPDSCGRQIITFAAYTGMREGEIFGLEWKDLRRGAGEIDVRRQLHKRRCTTPKNGEPRTITLPPEAEDVLDSLDRRKPILMVDETGTERSIDLVFRNKEGGPMSATSLYGLWDPVRVAIGRPKLKFHGLRHFCATWLLELFRSQGSEGSADVATQLGHLDDGELVRERYGHTDDDLARERIKKLFERPTELRPVEDDQEAANG
jgi:integrase